MADVLKYSEFVRDMQGVISRRNGVTTFVGHRRGRPFIGEYDVNKYLQTPPSPAVLFARLRFSVVMSQVAEIYADKAELERWRVRWRVSGGPQKTLRGFIISTLYTSYSPSLPAGYQACEFLQSDGKQYIRLSGLRGKVTILYLSAALLDTTAFGTIAGCNASPVAFCLRRWNKNSAFQYFIDGSARTFSYKTGQNVKILNNIFYVDDVVLADDLQTPTLNQDISLFAAAQGSAQVNFAAAQIAEFAVVAETKSISLVPALDNNGKPCMFDYIGGIAYYNEGAGEFTYKLAE